jgi:hypothetical protein
MPKTPFLPGFSYLAGSRKIATAGQAVRSWTLSKLEQHFADILPSALLLPASPGGPRRRKRVYPHVRTFWCFLWQCLTPQTACRHVVRQVQALFKLSGGPSISSEDGAYCRARLRLCPQVLWTALQATAQALQRLAPGSQLLGGRCLKVIDGSSVSAPDSVKNRKAYPKIQSTYDGLGFPMMRIVVLFCLASGAIVSVLTGNLLTSELSLFYQMMPQLKVGDIILGDRGFGNFVVVGLLQQFKIDFIGRSLRKVDGRRRLRRLGHNDWLVQWKRTTNPSSILSPDQWAEFPKQLTVRIVRGSLGRKGFRIRQVTLVTTLLDPQLYPAQEILQAYLRRWRLEMCFDDLKTTMGMEMLRCQSPAMLQKELLMYLIAHNLIRLVIIQAAQTHRVSVERISFKGSIDALRQFTQAICQAPTKRKRRLLWQELLRALAEDLLPERPGRREPRAIKRIKHKYPRLNCSRHKFKDHPKRHLRRKRARLRRLALK